MPFLYLRTKGWKTGKPHEVEIWYVQHKGRCYVVSEMRQRSHWIQNIKHHPRVEVSVGKGKFQGKGRILNPKKEPQLVSKVSDLMERKYDWSEGTIVEIIPD